eukprot:COSAG02_NODE_14631_length_1252_cov_9.076240_2_plen_75_part_00
MLRAYKHGDSVQDKVCAYVLKSQRMGALPIATLLRSATGVRLICHSLSLSALGVECHVSASDDANVVAPTFYLT